MSRLRTIFISVIKYIVAFAIYIHLSSCKKDEPLISNTPAIEFVSVTPASYTEYSGEITFTISYKDGDGNLGENNPDVKNLFLTDNRNNVTYQYRIQQLSPDGSTIAIQGNIKIKLSGTGITDASNSQTFSYSIYIVDRAGNRSNTVTSSAITVSK